MIIDMINDLQRLITVMDGYHRLYGEAAGTITFHDAAEESFREFVNNMERKLRDEYRKSKAGL